MIAAVALIIAAGAFSFGSFIAAQLGGMALESAAPYGFARFFFISWLVMQLAAVALACIAVRVA